jgi:hypothetical protein
MVINHNNFCVYLCSGFGNRKQALLQKVFDIVVDYDNG